MASKEALLRQSQPGGSAGPARRPKSKAFLDDDDIVMAVLDLYKRSLAPSREVIESTSLSFAGSFVGSMANSSHGAGVGNKASGQAPAVVVACEASLADVLLAGNLPLNLSSADGASSPTSHDSGAMLPQDGPGFGSSHLGNGIFRESYGGASAGSSPLRTRTFSFSELPVLIERLANCGRISSLTSTSSRGKALDKEAPSSNRNEVCWLQCVGGEAALTAMCDLGLRLHSVARRQFKDASPQAVVNHLDPASVVVSGVTVFAPDDGVLQAHRLTLYVRPGLLITLERELLVDGHRSQPPPPPLSSSSVHRSGANVWTMSSVTGSGNGNVSGGGVAMPSTAAAAPRQPNEDIEVEVEGYSAGLPVHHGVMAHLMNCELALAQLGTGLLVYLLLSELTRMMGSVLDLYARCLAHLQRTVDLRRVTHQRRLKVMRDLHNLQSGLVVLKAFFANHTATKLKSPPPRAATASSSSQRRQMSSPPSSSGVMTERHMPYLRDLEEAVKWVKRTISAHEAAIQEVRENLTVVSELRAQQVNTTLSLVATIFLPLTFLTGVFGMNFQYEEGKYSVGIGMLNYQYGALYFWAICACFIAVTLLWFKFNGWSDTLRHDQLAWG